MLKSYKYRLYPTKDQSVLINKTIGCCRFVYNYALNEKIKQYKNDGEQIERFKLSAKITKLKKLEETIWLSEVSSIALQQELLHLELAYNAFFKKQNEFPKFKSKRNNKNSFSIVGYDSVWVDFDKKIVKLPKIGKVKCIFDRTFDGKIGTCTVSKTPTGKYFISILVDDGKELPKMQTIDPEKSIGIDTGIKTFLTLSNGKTFKNNHYLKNSLDRLACLQRRVSRKVIGSENRKKANLKTAKIHEKITNQRLDYIHQVTHKLIGENQAIFIEDLNVHGMMSNRNLSQALSDVSLGKFYEILAYKCLWNGIPLTKIGRFEASSKTCSGCGFVKSDLKLSDRTWQCGVCGEIHDRDLNAAKNIKAFGLKTLTGAGCSVGSVESPTLVGAKKQKKAVEILTF